MKKLLTVIFSLLLLFSAFAFPNGAYAAAHWTDGLSYDEDCTFDGGDGNENNPYIINSETSLAQLAVNVNGGLTYSGVYFRLESDLDLSGKHWVPIGSYDPNNKFSGRFDGNGHTISNLTVDDPSAQGAGLFGYMTGAYICDLGVVNCNVTGERYVGGLAGFADGNTSIHNCYTTGSVTADNRRAGGLVGHYGDSPGTIDRCWSSANVNGGMFTGGLVGSMSNAHITNSHATGTVVANSSSAGGFIGYCEKSVIERCYATGDVAGSTSVGGFVGYTSSPSDGPYNIIKNCFARGDVTSTWSTGSRAGGFIGEIFHTHIYNCYSTGHVSFTASVASRIGGFAGSLGENFTFTDCYLDTQTAGREAVGNEVDSTSAAYAGITGLTAANMQGWDTLTNPAKMDNLDSGYGAPVAGVPIWYPHSADYPDFTAEPNDSTKPKAESKATLPKTGQDFTWVYLLGALAVVAMITGLGILRRTWKPNV